VRLAQERETRKVGLSPTLLLFEKGEFLELRILLYFFSATPNYLQLFDLSCPKNPEQFILRFRPQGRFTNVGTILIARK
jgi:hypothetical protein